MGLPRASGLSFTLESTDELLLRLEPDQVFLSTQTPCALPGASPTFSPHAGEKGRSWALCYLKLTPLVAHAGDRGKDSQGSSLLPFSSGRCHPAAGLPQVLFDWTKGSLPPPPQVDTSSSATHLLRDLEQVTTTPLCFLLVA